jgi:hypothetical protein
VGSRSKARARAQASQGAGLRSPAPRQSPAARQSRAGAGTPSAEPAVPVKPPRPVLVLAAIEAVEAVGVLVASVLAAIDTGTGQSYQLKGGVAITVIGFCAAIGLGFVARGLRSGRRWTRTPAMLTQLFVGIIGIYLIQAHRYDWGISAVLLAVAGFAMLMAPASVQLLTPGRVEKPGQG